MAGGEYKAGFRDSQWVCLDCENPKWVLFSLCDLHNKAKMLLSVTEEYVMM